jgi:hypothetical protein
LPLSTRSEKINANKSGISRLIFGTFLQLEKELNGEKQIQKFVPVTDHEFEKSMLSF